MQFKARVFRPFSKSIRIGSINSKKILNIFEKSIYRFCAADNIHLNEPWQIKENNETIYNIWHKQNAAKKNRFQFCLDENSDQHALFFMRHHILLSR